MIIPLESSFLTVSCLCRIWRDFLLYVMLHALPIASWLWKCMHTNANGLGQNRISIKKFRSLLTYSPTLSRAPSSKIIVELAIHVSFEIFLRDCSSTNSKYISTREFYFILPMIQFASLYLSILLDIVIMQDIVLSIILNTPQLYLLSSNEFIWDHLWTDSV